MRRLLIAFSAALSLWAQAADSLNHKTGIAIGAQAPDFALPDQTGRSRSLASLTGKNGLMLYFVRSADW